MEQQVLPDPEGPEHGALDRAEGLTYDGPGLGAVDELRLVGPVVDAVDADLAAARGPDIAGPIRLVPEGQRDDERVAGQPSAGGVT